MRTTTQPTMIVYNSPFSAHGEPVALRLADWTNSPDDLELTLSFDAAGAPRWGFGDSAVVEARGCTDQEWTMCSLFAAALDAAPIATTAATPRIPGPVLRGLHSKGMFPDSDVTVAAVYGTTLNPDGPLYVRLTDQLEIAVLVYGDPPQPEWSPVEPDVNAGTVEADFLDTMLDALEAAEDAATAAEREDR